MPAFRISYLCSEDTRFRPRISNTRGDHIRQPKNKSAYPKDTLSRAKIEAILSLLFEPFLYKTVPSFQNTTPKPKIWSTSCQSLQS